MKNSAFLILLFNMCLSTLQSEVGLASPQNNNPGPPPRAVNIMVDPRIELLAVVQFLSGYDQRFGLIPRFDFPYKQDVREYFSKHKSHSADYAQQNRTWSLTKVFDTETKSKRD